MITTLNIDAALINGNLNDNRVVSAVVKIEGGQVVKLLSRNSKEFEGQTVDAEFFNTHAAIEIAEAAGTEGPMDQLFAEIGF